MQSMIDPFLVLQVKINMLLVAPLIALTLGTVQRLIDVANEVDQIHEGRSLHGFISRILQRVCKRLDLGDDAVPVWAKVLKRVRRGGNWDIDVMPGAGVLG